MATITKSHRSYTWFWIAGLWLGIATWDATQMVFAMRHEGMNHSWGRLFFALALAWLPWALATPIVVQLGRRYPPGWKSISTWLIHISAIVTICAVASAWATMLEVVLQPWLPASNSPPFAATWPVKFLGGLLPAHILYVLILTVTYVLDSKARAAALQTVTARLNEQLSYAQLNALQR